MDKDVIQQLEKELEKVKSADDLAILWRKYLGKKRDY